MNILTALHAKRYAAGNRKDQKQYKAPKNLSLASHTSCYCWDSSMAIWARRISGVVYHYNRLRAINRVILIRKRSRRRRIHGLRLIGPSRRLIEADDNKADDDDDEDDSEPWTCCGILRVGRLDGCVRLVHG